MKKILLILLLLPFFGHAEGQDAFGLILDVIDFVKVFAVWAIIVFPTVLILNHYRTKKLSYNFKAMFYIGTGLIALFVFSMVRFDSQPYDGPIDSLFHKEYNSPESQTEELQKILDRPDSTIEETLSAIDTSEVGIYIWLNHKKVFVRKPTPELKWQRQQDSLTMAIVRGWQK